MPLSVRFSVRTLLLLVALCACALAAVMMPLQRRARHQQLVRRMEAAFMAFHDHQPPQVTPHGWHELIVLVGNVWLNTIAYGPVDNDRVEAAVSRLEADAARAQPGTAGALLTRSLDDVAALRPDKVRFIRGNQTEARRFLAESSRRVPDGAATSSKSAR